MRSHALLALVLCLFAAFAAAWTKEDHEIFRIRDEVAKADGANVTFYDLLGVKPSASQDQLTQALRKKSRELHPDKARKVFVANYAKNNKKGKPSNKEIEAHLKKVTASYQRLSVVGKMLKGPERERYDHFLRNGFPAWRGSGYYYERFRPGLGSVIVGLLAVFGGGFHYFALLMSWKRRREFAERYIRQARKTAWGDESGLQGIPGVDDTAAPVNAEQFEKDSPEDTPEELGPRNRRERRAMEKDARKPKKAQAVKKARADGISTPVEAEVISGPQGAKKRIVAENGKVLVVDSVGNVFLEIENEDGMKGEYLVDPDEEPKPTIYDTLLFKLPKFAYNQSVGRVLGKKEMIDEPLLETSNLTEEEAAIQNATASNLNGEARKRKAMAKKAR
jgi:curved DNA-binding protein CbpA